MLNCRYSFFLFCWKKVHCEILYVWTKIKVVVLWLHCHSLLLRIFPFSDRPFRSSQSESPSKPQKRFGEESGSPVKLEESSRPSEILKNIFVPLDTIKSSMFLRLELGFIWRTAGGRSSVRSSPPASPVFRPSGADHCVRSGRDPYLSPLRQRLSARPSGCCRDRRLHSKHFCPLCERLPVPSCCSKGNYLVHLCICIYRQISAGICILLLIYLSAFRLSSSSLLFWLTVSAFVGEWTGSCFSSQLNQMCCHVINTTK